MSCMKTTTRDVKASICWGIYRRDREYAREVGDPCLGVVEAVTKPEAEAEAGRRGIAWADLSCHCHRGRLLS